MKACKCGSTEFVSNLNSYDVFELIEGKLLFKRTEISDDIIRIYCSKCYKEYRKFEISG
jgi:hypothetical protein